MSRTYRRKPINWSSPRDIQPKRRKEALRAEIEEELEELRRIQSPLYRWEKEERPNIDHV